MQKLDPKCLNILEERGFETDSDLAHLNAKEVARALHGIEDSLLQQILDVHSSLSNDVQRADNRTSG
eukprot:11172502-Karenia_brevis.AAC.1